ncbi:MAG: hypothetical protein MR787_05365 [Bacteroidales bacterium]|nr:hypothetical protein [Bacteroidales bacterium]
MATSTGLFATIGDIPTDSQAEQLKEVRSPDRTTEQVREGAPHEVSNTEQSGVKRYTFSDFFDALDLPTVLGAGFRPDGIESASFNAGLRLGWRHHKNYGAFVYLSYNPYSATYDSLCVANTNVRSGENWYHEVSIGVGYRVPLVRDIRGFYQNPYFHEWDFFCAIWPGAKINVVKNVEPMADAQPSTPDAQPSPSYRLTDQTTVIPTLGFSAGVEWFVMPNFGIFVEAAYVQHLMPTVVEQAAIKQGRIRHAAGPMSFNAGLSLFFN